MSFRRILIAVDAGPLAAHAVEAGAELAASPGAEIALVHAIEPELSQAPGIAPEDLIAEGERAGRELMAGFRKLLPASAAAPEFIRVGRAAAEIVGVAKEWPADLIVIGSHGRHGISRVLLGSVAEAVMRHAPCAVLVVR